MLKQTTMVFSLVMVSVPLAYGSVLGTLDDIASAAQTMRNISGTNQQRTSEPQPVCPQGYTCTPKVAQATPSSNAGIVPSLQHVPAAIPAFAKPPSRPQETTQEAADQSAAQKAELEMEALQPRVGNPVDRRIDAQIKAQADGKDDNTPIN